MQPHNFSKSRCFFSHASALFESLRNSLMLDRRTNLASFNHSQNINESRRQRGSLELTALKAFISGVFA